jgi:hypothetical protein
MGGEEEPAEDDVELEQLMRELDGMDGEEEMIEGDDMELEEEDDMETDMMEGDEMPTDDEIYEMIMREMDGEEEMVEESEDGGVFTDSVPNRQVNSENRRLKKENKRLVAEKREALLVVSNLKKTINEINLLNAKLLYNTKINKNFELNRKQKTFVLETLDKSNTVREAKLVYVTLLESLNKTTNLKKTMTEGYASKATPTIKKKALTENSMVARWKELANIK